MSNEITRSSLDRIAEKMRTKVANEYGMGLSHVKDERVRKREIMGKVLETNLPDSQVRINLLWRNIQLEKALFLTDEVGVKFLATEGITGEEIMRNADVVAKYDDIDMELRSQREAIVDYNALYWLAATVVDGFDSEESQPISDVIDPLAIIPDPSCYSGSKMRFIGYERTLSKDFLENNPAYNIKGLSFSTSQELADNKRESDNANNLENILVDEGNVDVYDHYTVFEGKKVLTTWVNSCKDLIRYVELAPLSEAEKKNPKKIKFPIQLHRRKPKLGSFFGVSIADEILQYQDAISVLTNLNLIQANNLALGPDIFVDERLGIDTETLSEGKPGGRIIPVTNDSWLPTQNGIYTQSLPAPNGYVDVMRGSLRNEAELTTAITSQAFGISQSGTQTKAEIQTLQQNANNILMWISNNYLQGQKEYWIAHYGAYVAYMGRNDRKTVAIYDKGSTISLSLKKEDFIAGGKVNVYVTSKSQETAENDKEFNKLLALANIYLSNMKKGHPLNDFLRLIGRKSNIRDFDEYRYIAPSVDEYDAMRNLPLLNKDIEVPSPSDGQDYLTYLLIYRQALPTEAAQKAIEEYSRAYMEIQKPAEEELMKSLGGSPESAGIVGKGNPQTANTALNNLNQGNEATSI